MLCRHQSYLLCRHTCRTGSIGTPVVPAQSAVIILTLCLSPRFLFENQSPAHVYYRWKLYTILQVGVPLCSHLLLLHICYWTSAHHPSPSRVKRQPSGGRRTSGCLRTALCGGRPPSTPTSTGPTTTPKRRTKRRRLARRAP